MEKAIFMPLDGVYLDIFPNAQEVLVIPDNMIVERPLPEFYARINSMGFLTGIHLKKPDSLGNQGATAL